MAINKLGIGAFVCKALRAEGIKFYGHYNDPLVIGRKHKWVGNMKDLPQGVKDNIQERIKLKLVNAGYRFRECNFVVTRGSYYNRMPHAFIVRTY
jgi:hypothetical protein